MDNAEEILQALEEFSKLKPKEIPKELDDYLGYVAKTGDPVYQWHLVKYLFHEKLASVIKEFYETSPTIDLPPCPNVDPFNYERLKTSLLERLETFSSAPFTVQRICELLTNPRKQYNRVDKFMRAIEKNILVVSTREPGIVKRLENDQTETVLNGIPDNKLTENDDRIINVCSENVQFSNSTDSTQIPVVLHACVIQEEIEISNSVSTSGTIITTETKSWCEISETEKDADLVIKTDLANTSETADSTTVQEPRSESPKSSNILFAENEIKNENVTDIQNDHVLRTETIGPTMPDSPDSPEPSSSDNLSDETVQPETIETENSCDVQESVNEDAIVTNVADNESDTVATNNSEETVDELKTVINVSEEVESQTNTDVSNEEETKLIPEETSPENTPLDSSNDSYQNVDSKPSSVDSPKENKSSNDYHLTSNAQESTQEENVTTETEVTSQTPNRPEDEESITEGVSVKEIEKENVESSDTEDSKKQDIVSVVEEATESSENDENVVSSDNEPIQKETEVKTIDENACGDSEVVSSNEILGEICEEPERKEGSIIHSTTNISTSEVESQTPTSVATVEEICVDQVSCSNEDEAMDVDESSNQQMITSECENEGEPMDQSDGQTHS